MIVAFEATDTLEAVDTEVAEIVNGMGFVAEGGKRWNMVGGGGWRDVGGWRDAVGSKGSEVNPGLGDGLWLGRCKVEQCR